MLFFAIPLFVVAALLGLFVLIAILQDKPTPKPVVFMHGIFAAIALLAVIWFSLNHSGNYPFIALTLFVVAALGGATLFTLDMMGKKLPQWLAILHPIIAATALVLLIMFVVEGAAG